MIVSGHIVDIRGRRIFPGEIHVTDGKITAIRQLDQAPDSFIMPGFVDAHIHIESSMLVPSEFARKAVIHGTVATVSDPHEIANVLGISGVHFMIENGKKVPFKFHFGAPSCVPATSFETAGAVIDADGIRQLMQLDDIFYLAEMMNYPGAINRDQQVMLKIKAAQDAGKPVDGHAPGVRGSDLSKYVSAGISTDHECFTHDEALEKLSLGMKVIIREGSAARNFEALIPLLDQHYNNIMFCSDDKHPDDLMVGHINELCARAVAKGMDVFKVLQAACVNPVSHYNMRVGQLQVGDSADFIVTENLQNFKILETYVDGRLVARDGVSFIEPVAFEKPNKFQVSPKNPADFEVRGSGMLRVIEALEGQLITGEIHASARTENGNAISDPENDILKICVVNRYADSPPAVAFIKNFGLKRGAIASSVAHDCHNIVAVGVTDEDICQAVNLVISQKGGVCAVDGPTEKILPLPVAGIMSDTDAETAGRLYQEVDALAKSMGSTLRAPFMTLSFMALLVIPDLKLSDKGLFSGKQFKFVDPFVS